MWNLRYLLTSLVLVLPFSTSSHAAGKAVELKVGDKAPSFSGLDDKNRQWDSEKHSGKKIYVFYFYPADMTGGCTKQACNYRDALSELKRDDVEVIGISGDSVENHQHFIRAHDLNFTLLADPEGKIAEAFGVQTGKGGSIEREIDGKTITLERGVTASRWTFVVDKEWRIAHKDTKVNAVKDTATVWEVIQGLE